MRCQEFREIMDSYIGDELLIETNHEVLRHLEDFRAFRANLRDAAFEPNAWEKFRRGKIFNLKLLTTAAACLLILAVSGALWLRYSQFAPNENTLAENNQSNQSTNLPQPAESPIVRAVQAAWREMEKTAIGDHENCAVKFNLAEDPITLSEAAQKFGRFNKDLDKAVIASVKNSPAKNAAEKIEFLEAHSCIFQGRRFAHVVLKYHNRLVSILVTDTDLPANDGETLTAESSDGKMSVASFRATRQAIFVVSDLSAADNLKIAQTISPAVRSHIERAEA